MIRLRALREEKQIKQLEIAQVLGVQQQAVSKYERGELRLSIEQVILLSRYFGVTSDYFLGISSQRNTQISDADARLVQAYHEADDDHRLIVDTALGLRSARPQSKSEAS